VTEGQGARVIVEFGTEEVGGSTIDVDRVLDGWGVIVDGGRVEIGQGAEAFVLGVEELGYQGSLELVSPTHVDGDGVDSVAMVERDVD
jgi:hypothetical protein